MNKVVLDASALLAVFFAEEGARVVEPVLYGATMSAVNYSEVLKKAVEKGGAIQPAKFFVERQGIDIVEFDAAHAESAASILPQTSPFGLSFADRACFSLGLRTGFKIYTAERRMAEVNLNIPVKLIRKTH